MTTRPVTHVLKNSDGDITGLCNPDESWSPRSASAVIEDVESAAHAYVVRSDSGDTRIQVVAGRFGKYLRTVPDSRAFNNLDELPICDGSIPIAPWSEIVRFAPVLQFHSKEEYFPMDPLEFLRSSRFRHHRAIAGDQGYTKAAQEWRSNDSHHRNYYDIPVDFVDSYGVHSNGKNRRPRDSNRGGSWNVFLQPRGRPNGERFPTGRVPVFVHAKQDTCATSKGADYVIQYWWFFGFNDSFAFFNHQGDWEHATAVISNGTLTGAYLDAHGKAHYYERAELEPASGDRITVYVAKGSHAAYPKRGEFHIVDIDKTDGGGPRWDTSRYLLPLRDRPWKAYAGAWGEVGEISDTTGPLGPWHKRYRC